MINNKLDYNLTEINPTVNNYCGIISTIRMEALELTARNLGNAIAYHEIHRRLN